MLLSRASTAGMRLREGEVAPGVSGFHAATWMTRRIRLESSCFLVGDILVDTSFTHAGPVVRQSLAGKPIHVIVCTHHHEDHVGSCGPLQRERGCPVFMRNHALIKSEGLIDPPPYRRLWWGVPPPYNPEEMPARVESNGRVLLPVPTPGHSQTQVALFEERTGIAFVGDLFISSGVTAVMPHENPYQIVDSLRRVADLEPRWLVNGHGLQLERPAATLRRKADRVERAAQKVRDLTTRGVPPPAIVGEIFRRGQRRNRIFGVITSGEFSRINFVNACLTHAREATPAVGDPASATASG